MQKANWGKFEEETGKIQPRSLKGKGVREIDEMVEEITRIVTEELDKYTPRIKTRTLPHPETDDKGSGQD